MVLSVARSMLFRATRSAFVARENCCPQRALSYDAQVLRRLFRKQPIAAGDILQLGSVQLLIVGFALLDVFLAVEERQEGVTAAPSHRRHLVQRATGKQQRTTFRWPVRLAAEFRKGQI